MESVADDEADAGRAAAADVERLHVLGALDLIVAGLAGDLPVRVEQLAHARGAHRVPGADQAAARIDRVLAADLDVALLDRFPALTGLGDAEGTIDVLPGADLESGEENRNLVRLFALGRSWSS